MKNNLEDMIEMRKQRFTYQEIADKHNISRQRVHQLLQDYCFDMSNRDIFIQKLSDAICDLCEYRGFFTGGKYINDDVEKFILPVVAKYINKEQ